jgi:two-component system chemotaxis response regulator CheY
MNNAKRTQHGDRTRKTILVVDDSELVRRLYADILTDAGFQVEVAADGEGAQVIAAELGRIDLLLADYHMPGMDGVDLVTWFQQYHPDVPVLIMSNSEEYIAIAEQAAPTVPVYLKSPVADDLVATVQSTIASGGGPRIVLPG